MKIFSTQFHKGSLIDQVSKEVGTATDVEFKSTEKGTAGLFNGSTSYIDTNITLSESVFSIEGHFKLKSASGVTYLLDSRDGGTDGFSLYFENGNITLRINFVDTVSPLSIYGDNKWHHVIAIYDGTDQYLYIDNQLVNSDNNASTISVTNTLTISQASFASSGYLNGYICKVAIYDHTLSTQERTELYKEFLRATPTEKPVRNFEYPKPTDLSYERNTDFTGDEYTQVMEFTDNASDTSTIRLNDSGDFAVVDWTGNSDFQEISTSSETTSSVIPSTVKIFAKNGVLTYFYSTNNNFSFDIADLPSGLTTYYNAGSNTTSGDIADLPSGLTYYYNTGYNTTSGDIADLPSGLTNYFNSGSNTTSGDIADLPSGLTTYLNYGYNTTSGDIADLPSGLTYYYNSGSNTTSGDIANLPSGLTTYLNTGYNTTSGDIADLPSELIYYRNAGYNQVNTYTSGHTFDSGINYFLNLPAAGYGLSSTEVDNLLIDLDNSGMSSGTIDLSGNNAARTSASDAAVTSLQGKGVSVIVNT